MKTNIILQGDALLQLKTLPDQSVDMCMTSPPYWALRDYNIKGQLGLEPTFDLYIKHLCDIFDEVKRILKDEGTLWVNLGDTYFGSGKGAGGDISKSKEVWGFKEKEKRICQNCGKEFNGWKFQNFCGSACSGVDNTPRTKKGILQDKCLIMIPQRFAIEMINRGWILRNVIVWYKPNAMPSSAKDRFTVDFEYLFFFSKKKKYYFETQYESHLTKESRPHGCVREREYGYDSKYNKIHYKNYSIRQKRGGKTNPDYRDPKGKNRRCVWRINTLPSKEEHIAQYPERLCEIPIKAGCRTGGIVLDPFFGAGTTGLVALKQGKKFMGIELNPEYIEIAQKRLKGWIEQRRLK